MRKPDLQPTYLNYQLGANVSVTLYPAGDPPFAVVNEGTNRVTLTFAQLTTLIQLLAEA